MKCPIQSKECLKEDCAWWIKCGMCAVAIIAEEMQSVAGEVDAVNASLDNIVDRGFPDPSLSPDSLRYAMRR